MLIVVQLLGWSGAAQAQPRVLPEGQQPPDRRLEPLKDLNGYFPFAVPETAAAWERRAERVRRQLRVALGIWPQPQFAPLTPVIHGRREFDGYALEKVYFESLPGFFVTGNLYRPLQPAPNTQGGRHPGILCPHGHWNQGRFYDAGSAGVRREIVNGAERFEIGGRSVLQARCVQLARMGCVVFHYDMIGYADSQQLSYELAHRFARQRPDMNRREGWGLFSPQAESRLQSVMGLQTINSQRALDFLAALPDVDPQRLAITGASGGGTQTFILSALDPRLAVSMPAVMVSTAMQGGCTCENCSLLRVDTGNVEFAALFAPKPQGLTAADDWTKEMATKGFPELRRLYDLLGAPKNVQLTALTHFGHNYNHVSRSAMYHWMNRHLKLGWPEPILERDYPLQSAAELTVWDDAHPRPPGGPDFERQLLAHWDRDGQRQLRERRQGDADGWRKYRELVGGAVDVLIGHGLPPAADVEFDQRDKQDRGSFLQIAGLVKHRPRGEATPTLFLYPKEWNQQVVIWLSDAGKAGLYQPKGDSPRAGEASLQAGVRQLLEAGYAVVGIDLFQQGEFLKGGEPLTETRRVTSTDRQSAGYTFGYNHSLFARRVHDILTLTTFVRHHEYTPQRVHLAAWDRSAAALAVAARAQARDAIDRLAVDTHGFRFAEIDQLQHPDFLPGGAKYDDLPGMLAVAAPLETWLAGEAQVPEACRDAYQATGQPQALTLADEPRTQRQAAGLKWLMR